jgi:hypothetical protein
MISKLGVGIFLSVATLFFATPTNVFAATSSADKAKINKYYKQLKSLPNAAAPASKVNSLVIKLTKLDPKKATKYFKLGLTKLATGPSADADATKIALGVKKVVVKAGLSSSQVKKIDKQVTAATFNYTSDPNNEATPSAMLHRAGTLVFA